MTIYAKRHQVYVPHVNRKPRSANWMHRQPNMSRVASMIGGEEELQRILNGSLETHLPVPIMGAGCWAHKGELILPIAGGAGFTSLSDLVSEATAGGKLQQLFFSKTGVTGVANVSSTLWYEGTIPAAGSTSVPALAAGANVTKATQGAMGPQENAAGGDQLHLAGGFALASVAQMTLLLLDRIWHGSPITNDTSAQTVTMTPSRYATTGAGGLSKGNVMFVEVAAALTSGGGIVTITYVDDEGNAPETTTYTGVSGAIAKRLEHIGIFIPLNAGDVGISDIQQWQRAATAPSSGTLALVLAHPLMWIPGSLVANGGSMVDGINANFNLMRVYDDAALMLLEAIKNATTATTYYGSVMAVAG